MVTEWGMSERIGPLNYSSGGQEVFLGREMTQKSDNCSEETARIIDEEVRRIVQEQYERAVDMLTTNRSSLELVGETLLEYESLSGTEIQTLLDGGAIDRPTKDDEASEDSAAEESEVGEKKRASLFPPIRPVGKKDPDPEPA